MKIRTVYSILFEMWFKVDSVYYDCFDRLVLVCSNKTFNQLFLREKEVI